MTRSYTKTSTATVIINRVVKRYLRSIMANPI